MVAEKYAVRLSAEDRDQLERLIRSGQRSARVINRARILLKTDEGWSAFQAAAALDTSPRTVFRTKRRYSEEGLDGVLYDHPQANRYRKLDDRGEAHLIALACSDAPEGHDHWTLRLLADKVVELGLVVSLSHETVRLNSKNTLQPWRKQQWGISRMNGEFVAAMEDVLDLYGEPYDPQAGGVLRRDLHPAAGRGQGAVASSTGRPRRQDYEYRRGGTRNLFLACEPLAGATWRSRNDAPCRTSPTRCSAD